MSIANPVDHEMQLQIENWENEGGALDGAPKEQQDPKDRAATQKIRELISLNIAAD